MQLRLGASFQSEIEFPAMTDDLFHNRLHLVYFDRIHHVVLAFIIVFLRGFTETTPCLLDAVVEDIWKPQQYRSLNIAQCEFVHHFTQVDLRGVFAGRDIDIAFVIHIEIGGTPPVDVVEFPRIVNRPFLHIL